MDYRGPEFQANVEIPVDLFISKNKKKQTEEGLSGGSQLLFRNSSGDLVFKFDRRLSHRDHSDKRLLVDAATGNPLISIARIHKGSWQGFREDNDKENDMMFKVERAPNLHCQTEFEVFLINGDLANSKPYMKLKGSPFHRSCTVYKGNSVVAQTSLMYKLGFRNVLVPRNKFRITIFPGFSDQACIVALIIIFFDGRKLWI